MLLEGGEWKVDESSWTNEKPAILAHAATPGAGRGGQGRGGAGERRCPRAAAAPVVGSMPPRRPSASSARRKHACVYKPVMTAEDLENCK